MDLFKWALKISILACVLLTFTYTDTADVHQKVAQQSTRPDSAALRQQAVLEAVATMDSILAKADSGKVSAPKDTAHFTEKDFFEAVLKLPSRSEEDTTRRVLVTGDSMGDGIFLALRKLRKKLGYKVDYAPWYGSKTSDWGNSQKLKAYIDKYKPDFVVFLLGANELFVPVTKKRSADVKRVVDMLKGTDYVWVGPPNWKKDWGTDSMIHASVGSARYFVSKNLKLERRPDGAHPSFKASEVWLDTILRWVNKNPNIQFKFLPQKENAEVKNKKKGTALP